MFITPSRSRKAAETDAAIMLPTREKESKRLKTAEAVAATIREVIMTMLGRVGE